MVATQSAQDTKGCIAPLWRQGATEEEGMPDSPLREAFELLHYHLLYDEEEGIDVNSARLSIYEEVEIDPDLAIAEAVRTGLVEEYADPDFLRRMLRRGPRSGEMLRVVYGRDGPPTLEDFLAEADAWSEFERAQHERMVALREAGRPKEHNTADSLPAWVP